MNKLMRVATVAAFVGAPSSHAQPRGGQPITPSAVAMRSVLGDPVVVPQRNLAAALPYDGSSTWGAKAQDFESVYDIYDLFIIDDIEPLIDHALGQFRSVAFGTGNSFGAEDFILRIFEDNGSGFPGEDSYTGSLVMTSVPGAGHWDGEDEFVTDMGGQCLPAGAYFLLWHTRMDFDCCGQSFFLMQAGDPEAGGGEANNAWIWNPGGAFGVTHFPIVDPGTNLPTGVNYLLFGEPSNCAGGCSSPDCPADLDLDGDADSDDFFLYLDRFAGGDPCADIDGDADADSDDFFAYLDQFAEGC